MALPGATTTRLAYLPVVNEILRVRQIPEQLYHTCERVGCTSTLEKSPSYIRTFFLSPCLIQEIGHLCCSPANLTRRFPNRVHCIWIRRSAQQVLFGGGENQREKYSSTVVGKSCLSDRRPLSECCWEAVSGRKGSRKCSLEVHLKNRKYGSSNTK